MTSNEAPLPRRVNLGCGYDRRPGYLNVDLQEFHGPDLVADVRDLSALPSDYFDEVLAVDVLEHLPRTDTAAALAEWSRILAIGGLLRLQVPDVLAIGRMLVERDNLADHELFIHHMYGTQAYTGDFHLAGFTDRLMIAALTAAGFESITTTCEHRWLLVADGRKADPNVGSRSSIAVAYDRGIYAAEPDGGGSTYRWCEARASILIENVRTAPIDIEVELAVAGHFDDTPVRLTVHGLGAPRELHLVAEPQHIRVPTRLPSDGLRIHLESHGPRVKAADDVRDLRFRLLRCHVRTDAPTTVRAPVG